MIFQTSLVRVLRGVKAGVDPGFFLGGGAPLSKLVASTLSHVFFLFFFFQNTTVLILESCSSSWFSQGSGESVHTLHSYPRSTPARDVLTVAK